MPGYWYQVAALPGSPLAARRPALVVPAPRTASTCGATRSTTRSSRWPARRGPSAAWCPTAAQARRSSWTPPRTRSSPASGWRAWPPTWSGPGSATWWSATTSTRPRSAIRRRRLVHQTLALSGFRRVASFGPPVTGAQTNPAHASGRSRPTCRRTRRSRSSRRPARPCGRRARWSRSRSATPCWSTAGPTALLQLAGQGVLGRQPAVIAGDPLAGRPLLWAVTDALRRADNAFGLINATASYTYTATETNPPTTRSAGQAARRGRCCRCRRRPPDRRRAVRRGRVTASSSGSWLSETPQNDPVNAFDGNPNTAWAEGDPDHPGRPVDPDHLRPPAEPARRASASSCSTAASTGRSRTSCRSARRLAGSPPRSRRTSATQPLRVPPGRTRWLRITITGASNVIAG